TNSGLLADHVALSIEDSSLQRNGENGLRQSGGRVGSKERRVTKNQTGGLSISDADSVQLQGGAVSSNGDNGVQALSTRSVTISGVDISANAGNGVSLSAVIQGSVASSTLSNNTHSGLLADHAQLSIEDSSLQGNGENGLRQDGG